MDVVELDRSAAAAMIDILAATGRTEYRRPTPCPEWDVGDLVAHVVAGNLKYIEIASGGNWTRAVPAVDEVDDAVATYRRTSEAMREAWEEPGARAREIDLPFGRGPAESALYIHLGETLVHGWDLAVACGRRPVFDDPVVQASLTQYKSWLPPERSGQTPFSDAVAVADDAPLLDQLAAYLGRDVAAWRP